jgi:hypothetical protein
VCGKNFRESGSGTGCPEYQLMFVNMFYLAFIVSYINSKAVIHLNSFFRFHLQRVVLNQSSLTILAPLKNRHEGINISLLKAEKLVEFFTNNVVFTHKCLACIISDQGTAFTAKFTADAMKGWSIRHGFCHR